MDFLVHNDFNLLISLDGDETSSSYRVYNNGKPAYQDIMKNVMDLKSRYPVYFEEKVNFNAVLHNLNSVSGIYNFFKTKFNKIPGISSLSTSGIAKDQEETFWETYVNVEESLYKSEDYSSIEKDMFLNLPTTRALALFIHQDNDCVFDDYNRLIFPNDAYVQFPTGTCTPFSKKIYITVNGKILPCERVGHQFMLGQVTSEDGVIIDYGEIARKYTAYFSKMKSQCMACHNSDQCTQCVFNLNDLESKPVCNGMMTKKDQSRQFSCYLDYIEDDPNIYTKLLKEAIME